MIQWLEPALVIAVVALVISIFAIVIAVLDYHLSKKTQLRRPHSERVKEVVQQWLKQIMYLPSVLNIATMPDGIISWGRAAPTGGKLDFALEHLATGYKGEHRAIKDLVERIIKHNKRTKRYFEKLVEDIREEVGVPDSSREPHHAYYRRIVVTTLGRMLRGAEKDDPVIEPGHNTHRLRWSSSDLVVGSHEECTKGKTWIEDLLESEGTRRRAKKLQKDAEKLEQEVSKIRERLQVKIVDMIEMGGTIKGKCSACS